MARNVALIGYRGVGKSTVGLLLAEAFDWRFVDTDQLVERRAGMSIAQIWKSEGESAFRRLESAVVHEVCAASQQVISLGGGAVVDAENRAAIAAAAVCVWLECPPETIAARLAADARTRASRPALTGHADPLDEIRAVLAARSPIYSGLAAIHVDAACNDPTALAADLRRRLAPTLSDANAGGPSDAAPPIP